MYIDVMYHGGAQRVMANLANDFTAAGVETVLVNDAVPAPGIPTYPIAETVRRYYLRQDFSGNVLAKNIERIAGLRKILKNENRAFLSGAMQPKAAACCRRPALQKDRIGAQ